MVLMVTAGLVVWCLAIVAVLALCRAAARGDSAPALPASTVARFSRGKPRMAPRRPTGLR